MATRAASAGGPRRDTARVDVPAVPDVDPDVRGALAGAEREQVAGAEAAGIALDGEAERSLLRGGESRASSDLDADEKRVAVHQDHGAAMERGSGSDLDADADRLPHPVAITDAIANANRHADPDAAARDADPDAAARDTGPDAGSDRRRSVAER